MITKSAESNEDFLNLLKKWRGIERSTINMTDKTMMKIDNPLILALMDTIKRDSEKHKEILGLIIDGLEGTTVITHEDMGALTHFIEKHAEIEKNSVEIAEQALSKVRTALPKFLLTYLLTDEKKHDMIMDGLAELKAKIMTPG